MYILIILILCLFYVIIGSMHRLLTAKYCISNSLNEIFIYFIIFLLSLYPSYILAKKHIKNTHFSDAVYLKKIMKVLKSKLELCLILHIIYSLT